VCAYALVLVRVRVNPRPMLIRESVYHRAQLELRLNPSVGRRVQSVAELGLE